ncbi:MAG: nuclear transport factor 2 family protein [Ignavibacteriales bacterium]|nr:MAG: nuclear transport factor 2 family protein [Ignavibacteriales bacterium]
MDKRSLRSEASGRNSNAMTLAQGKEHRSTRMCALCIVLFLLAVPAFGQTTDRHYRNQERELAAIEKQWWDSIKDHDRAKLERILADDFMGVDDGEEPPTTKQRWVDWAMNFQLKSYVIEKLDMRITAETAIVSVHYSTRVIVRGKETSDSGVDLDIFVRRDRRWQALGTGEIKVVAKK